MGTKIQTKRILKGFSSTSNIIHTMDLGAKRGRSYGFPLCTTMAPNQVPHTLCSNVQAAGVFSSCSPITLTRLDLLLCHKSSVAISGSVECLIVKAPDSIGLCAGWF
jgi:hypothetical protein